MSERSQRLKNTLKMCCSEKLRGGSNEEKAIKFLRFSYSPFKDIIEKLREIFNLLHEAGLDKRKKMENISRAREIFNEILSTYGIRKVLPEELDFDIERAFLAIQANNANQQNNLLPNNNAIANNNFPDIDLNAIPLALDINQHSFYLALNRLKREQYLGVFESVKDIVEKEIEHIMCNHSNMHDGGQLNDGARDNLAKLRSLERYRENKAEIERGQR